MVAADEEAGRTELPSEQPTIRTEVVATNEEARRLELVAADEEAGRTELIAADEEAGRPAVSR